MPRKNPSLVPASGTAVADPPAEDVDAAAAALLETVEAPAPLIERTSPVSLGLVELDKVQVGENVRTDVDGDDTLEDLAASIRQRGVLSPITVEAFPDGQYRVVYGQRRVLAARLAEHTTIPAIIVETSPRARIVDQLVENLHRRDLNPIERARGIAALVEGGMSQVDVGKLIGRAESTISNDLRLLELTPKVQDAIATAKISASHGKAIVSLPPKQQDDLARNAIARDLSSHEFEREIGYAGDAAKQDAKRANNTKRTVATLAAKLKEAGVPDGARIGISSRSDVDMAPVTKAAKEAGYEVDPDLAYVSTYYGVPEGCTCTTYLATVGGRTKIERVCNVAAHREKGDKAKRATDERERQAREKRGKVIAAHVNDLVVPALAKAYADLPRPVLELVVAARRGYLDDGEIEKINKATTKALVESLAAPVVQEYSRILWQIDQVATLAELGLDDPVKPTRAEKAEAGDVDAAALVDAKAKRTRKPKATSPSTTDANGAEAPSDTDAQVSTEEVTATPSERAPADVDDAAPAAN